MIKRQTCTGHAVDSPLTSAGLTPNHWGLTALTSAAYSPNLFGLTPNPSPEGRG